MPFVDPFETTQINESGFVNPDLDIVDEDTFLESIVKGGARGFRTIPKSIGAGLEILGIEDTLLQRELERGEKFVTPRTTDPAKIIAGEIASGVTQYLSIAGTAGVLGGVAGAAIGGTGKAALAGAEAATIATFGVTSGLTKYKEEIDIGVDPVKAGISAVTEVGLVVASESLVAANLFKKGLTPLKRFVNTAISDMFGEELELIGGTLADKLILDRPLPTKEEFAKEAAMTLAVSLGTSAVLSKGSDLLLKGLPQDETINSDGEADLGIELNKQTPEPTITPSNMNSTDKTDSFEQERAPLEMGDSGEQERARREVLDEPSELKPAKKTYKGLVKDGIITEKTNTDISKIDALISFMHNKAKKFKELAPIYEEGLRSMHATDTLLTKYGKTLDPYFNLSKASKKKVDSILIQEHTVAGRRANGIELAASFTRPELEGYVAMREVADIALQDIGNMLIDLGRPEEEVAEFMDSMEDTWIPLSRFGKYFVAVNDKFGNLISYSFHESKSKQRAEAVKQADKGNVTVGEIKRSSDELMKDMPVNVLSALRRIDELDDVLGLDISKAYAAALQQGFPTHLLKQKKVRGFDQDIGKSMSNYLLGLGKYIERRKSRANFSRLIESIDPKSQPRLHEDAVKYADYITGHRNELSKFRQFLFRYYLGGNIKSAIVNATQTLTTTFPSLSKYTGNSAAKLLRAGTIAAKPLDQIRKTDPNLADALQTAIYDGVIQEQFVTMLRGEAYKGLQMNRVDKALSFFFNHVEVFNRKVAFISAYKAAITEGIKTRGEDGKKRITRLTHEEAIQFAEGFVDETQFNYSKADRPRIARGVAAPAFTFRLFAGNYLSMLKNYLAPPEAAGLPASQKLKHVEFGAMARAIGVMMTLGGVTAIPGMKDLEKALEAAGYDPRKMARDAAGDYGDFLLHGGLFPTGVDISGAVGTVEFVPNDIQQGAWGAVGNIVLGVPTDLPKRISRAIFLAHDLKDPWRAVEAVMPEAVRNPMVAIRWAREGAARTPFGEPIANPKIGDVILKALAIQPALLTRAYEREHSEKLLSQRAREVSENVSFRIARAIFQKDEEGLKEIYLQISEHNASVTAPEDLIILNPKTIKQSLTNMIHPESVEYKRLPKKARQEFINIQETFRQE